MKIKWLGHACFKLTSDKGISIITDPYDESVGYELPDEEADVVTISHGHHDHNYHEWVKGNPELVSKLGSFYVKDIPIKGIRTYHDEDQGEKRGANIIYCMELDGIRVCHCGDLGHVLTPDQVQEIGVVDVLLLPVGGTYTVDGAAAAKVAAQLKPRCIIPMHFKTPATQLPIQGVEPFLDLVGGGEHLHRNHLVLNREDLGEQTRVVVLDYQ